MTWLSSSNYQACCHILSQLQRPQRAFRQASKKRIAIVKEIMKSAMSFGEISPPYPPFYSRKPSLNSIHVLQHNLLCLILLTVFFKNLWALSFSLAAHLMQAIVTPILAWGPLRWTQNVTSACSASTESALFHSFNCKLSKYLQPGFEGLRFFSA